MSEENQSEELTLGRQTRRSFVKQSAVATAGIVGFGSATAGAQVGDLDEGWKALVSADNFHPQGRFTFVSGVVDWTPNYGDVQDSWFSDYNTRMIQWVNTNQTVPLYVAHDANVGEYDEELGFVTDADDDPNQPQLFEVDREWTPFSDNPRLVTINASPVAEEQEDEILENEDWWQTGDDGTTGGNQTASGDGTTGNGTATTTVGDGN